MIPQGRLNVQEVTRAIGMLQTGMSQDTDGKLMNRSLSVVRRLEFARENRNWQICPLRSVLLTEESKFCVDLS